MRPALPLILLGAVLLACDVSAVGPNEPTTTQSNLRASQITSNTRVPFELFADVPCANAPFGELVQLSGALHILVHQTTATSGTFLIREHFQPQGVSGTGLATGVRYRGTGVTQTHTHQAVIGGNFTFVNNFRLIGPGSGNNFLVHQTAHGTINANGALTVSFDRLSVDCR